MAKVVGIKSIVSKKDKTPYTELHLVSEDKFVLGYRCETVFVRSDRITNLEALALDSDVTVFYNRFGRVESVSVLI